MTYKNLRVWKKADELALKIYKISCNFPKDEMYGLTSQLRRAALSIPTNMVEGYSRKGDKELDKELARFVNISIGSLAEVEYLLSFARRLGYFSDGDYEKIEVLRAEVGSLLWSFYKKVTF